jgi:DNA-binding response OmpR family regulator
MSSAQRRRILLLEDSPEERLLLARRLSKAGYDVLCAEDAALPRCARTRR